MHPLTLPMASCFSMRVRAALGLVFLSLVPAETMAHPPRPWVLRLDLFDVDGAGRTNQRHFQHWSKRTVVCCLDVAWMPWNPLEGGVQLGGGIGLGGWVQDLESGPHVRVVDILLEGSARWSGSQATLSPWARLDAGPAILVVERRQVGVDWGVGGAFQAGFALNGASADLLVGVGVDIRRYVNLRVEDIPAMTLSVGVAL